MNQGTEFPTLKFLILVLFALVATGLSPLIGASWISPSVLMADGPSVEQGSGDTLADQNELQVEQLQRKILLHVRLPRVVMALLAGTALALGGLVFQAMFRNPLATPFTLGVASGASLLVAICIFIGLGQAAVGGFSLTQIAAIVGAVGAIALVYMLARATGEASPETLLLAGVAISFTASSLILFFQYMSDFTRSLQMVRWVMGGLSSIVDWHDVLTALPVVFAASAVIAWHHRELNLVSLGRSMAMARGVDVRRTRLVLFLATSFSVGMIVALCGPIGFVGLMAPHICRRLVGWDHRYLLPATILFGGPFLALCDAIGRTLLAPAELPVGIITALLGGPFFIWLLLREGAGTKRL